jgi:L-aspartate oxidase
MPGESIKCDYLVIGSGIAGLSFAIHAARRGRVIMITKKSSNDTNTNRAQGGIACVLDPHDTFESHLRDTLVAGAGLCKEEAVRILVENGPARIHELIDWGIKFSKSNRAGNRWGLHLGKEGGHSVNRIVHAHDLTGREVEKTLLHHLRRLPSVTLFENHVAVELITNHQVAGDRAGNRCYGAYVFDSRDRSVSVVQSRITCLATGGAGQVYLHTTNPEIATGDGIGMAYRAGAAAANMEFIQFHPTCLFHPEGNSFLISEALRGFGAVLKDSHGREFMKKYHPLQSLAPRDIVARAIDTEIKKSGDACVFLDIRHVAAASVRNHFPGIYARCLKLGIDITRDRIPVVPTAHYLCGGVQVDLQGNSTIANLYACGETACTGIHGANRLASNSLLEALVFAKRAADDSASKLKDLSFVSDRRIPAWDDSGTIDNEEWVLLSHNFREIRSAMWDYVGIVRSNFRLHRASRRIAMLEGEIEDFYRRTKITPRLLELRNMVTTASLIVTSALRRRESRGLHYTTDYPQSNDRYWKKDTVLAKAFPP